MTFKTTTSFVVTLACALLMVASCLTLEAYHTPGKKRGHGPPPHAPAHGYRCKLPSKVEVVFDSNCGVYVVVGLEKHFWLNGQYYRFCNGQWEVSMTIESGWEVVREEKLPPGLCKKYKDKHASKKHPGIGWARGKNKW
jgi:hypothetical protein